MESGPRCGCGSGWERVKASDIGCIDGIDRIVEIIDRMIDAQTPRLYQMPQITPTSSPCVPWRALQADKTRKPFRQPSTLNSHRLSPE